VLEYTLTVNGSGGAVSVDGTAQSLPWSETFACGSSVSLEGVADEHHVFAGWSGDLAGDENPTALTIDGDKTVTVSFFEIQYTLSLTTTGAGTVLVAGVSVELPWSGAFGSGSSVTLEAVPEEDTEFIGWSGDVSLAGNPIEVAIDADKDIVVVFFTPTSYTDISNDYWAVDAIEALTDAGIVNGYPDGFYRPTITVDRGSLAVYIARAMTGGDVNVPAGPVEPTFPDVTDEHWAYDYVEYAAGSCVVEGYPDGNYHADWHINRAQMAVFVARSIVEPTGEAGMDSYEPPADPTFRDVPTNYWCFKHIEYLAEHDVVNGYPDGNYNPSWEVTRDQMAVYIMRAFDLPF